ncbi:MAG: hypothetical protein ACI3YC_02245, partial [Alloprevotella sp.]
MRIFNEITQQKHVFLGSEQVFRNKNIRKELENSTRLVGGSFPVSDSRIPKDGTNDEPTRIATHCCPSISLRQHDVLSDELTLLSRELTLTYATLSFPSADLSFLSAELSFLSADLSFLSADLLVFVLRAN